MAQYVKHKSNYIRTNIHQHLKGGSTIFERDWVTVGSQLNFGPGKIPYYNNGNFIFTTSPIPYYQKRYKNGTSSVTWTYENVKDAQPTVNQIQFDEYTEDIRSYAYYGSCVELVRSTIENIINTFPGNIIVSDKELGLYKQLDTFDENTCGQTTEEIYAPLTGSIWYTLDNPFNIDLCLTDVDLTRYDNPLHYLGYSFKDYVVSTDCGNSWSDIESYTVVTRSLYEKEDKDCIQTKKVKWSNEAIFEKPYTVTWKNYDGTKVLHQEVYLGGESIDWNSGFGTQWYLFQNGQYSTRMYNPYGTYVREDLEYRLNREVTIPQDFVVEMILQKTNRKRVYLKAADYHIEKNGVKQGWSKLCYDPSDTQKITLNTAVNELIYNYNSSGGVVSTFVDEGTQGTIICTLSNEKSRIVFYSVEKIKHTYKSYQMLSQEEYIEGRYADHGWIKSICPLNYWLPKTTGGDDDAETEFLNLCDNAIHSVIRYSYLDEFHNENLPVYTILINGNIQINGYIYNGEVIPLVLRNNLVIQPKEEIIEEYFNGLKGLEKQLLTRKTKPLYTSRFITPIEYNLGYLYYKRTYTWPHMYYCKNSSTTPAKESYCIDITSPSYVEFLNKLSAMAESFDELWTDNMWRRMTHEAIKNYDWTYTREYVDGDEEENVEGGERMHKVINVIGRVFDDVKLRIDTIKKANTITYNGDRNMPNALISDKLELKGWDIYSTIWPLQLTEEGNVEVPTSEYFIKEGFNGTPNMVKNLFYTQKWYPSIRENKITFADVDNDFMRKLLLSTNRIMMSKGTVNSIDMVMGLFGYGRMDEGEQGHKPDYEIHEEYYSTIPINYEMTFKQIAEEKINGKDKYECYADRDEEEQQRDKNDKEVIGDKIVRLNSSKDSRLLYYDDVSGIPVGSFVTNDTTYLIPFYDQSRMYDGNFYFQGKGGWGYNTDSQETIDVSSDEYKPNPYKWTETISYLHVVSQVKDLLNVVPNDVHEGDIFYVSNISDLIDYTETLGEGRSLESASHFFVLNDEFNPEEFDSWKNVNMSDVNNEDTKKAKYLDSIIPYNLGNNPHVGYGFYDMGKEYFDYMKQPFKYSVDNDGFETIEDMQDAERIRFCIKKETDENKVKIFGDELKDEDKLETITMKDGNYYWGKKDGLECKEYKLDNIKSFSAEKYYLNSKIIRIKNNLNREHYKNYFKNVIIKYLMQVIPSTAILVLEDF